MTSITVSVDGLSPTDLVGYARMFAELANDPKRSAGHREFLAEMGCRLREAYDQAKAGENVVIDWLDACHNDVLADAMHFGDDPDFPQPIPEPPARPGSGGAESAPPILLGWSADLDPVTFVDDADRQV